MKPLLHALLLSCLAICAVAQGVPPPVRVTIKSEILHEDRLVLVRLPRGYDSTTHRYPVIYMTDGSSGMPHAISTIEFLVRNSRMPDVIVVGIENTDRNRDLTPTRLASGTEGFDFDISSSGGADNFLRFIETELMPEMDKRYRTGPYRIFAGHSFGGLFAVHALITRPELFGAYIAASPSLQWDKMFEVKRAEKFFKERKDLNKTLFITIGDEGGPMQQSHDRLVDILKSKAPKNFVWSMMPMLDEDHGSSVLRAYYFGLRKVFSDWRVPVDPGTKAVAGGVKGADEHYRKISEKYGLSLRTPEAVINRIGYEYVRSQRYAEAVGAFKINVERFPQSANAYDSLAEGYTFTKQYALALESAKTAVRLGEQAKLPNVVIFRDRMDKLAAGLDKAGK
ncbi:MAG TPA: alpha/beta hydrolase-fold protein [Terriglobales bacterium]|nr:alpha/beta hydrolase-fold protein [Terriglobales bacterium]